MSAGVIASQAFVPNKNPGLKLAMDASDLATIVSTSGDVDEWKDKSSGSNKATQGLGARKPKTGTRKINGHNVLDFDGIDDALDLDSQPIIGTEARTIIAVGFADNSDTENIMVSLSDFAIDVGGQYRVTPEIGVRINGANRLFPDDAVESGKPAIIIATNEANSNLLLDANNLQIYKDNVLLTGGTSVSPTTSINTHLGMTAIGDDGEGPVSPLKGVIAELIVHDRVLTTIQRDRASTYLFNKWLATFDPSKIPGLVCWLDAADLATIIASGGGVTSWLDKSPEGNNAIELGGGASNPITGVATLNGRNVLTWNGSDTALKVVSNSFIDNIFNGGASIFSVVRPAGPGGGAFGRIIDKGNIALNFIREPLGGKSKYAHIQRFSGPSGTWRTQIQDVIYDVGNILGTSYDSSSFNNLPTFRVDRVEKLTNIESAPTGTFTSDVGEDMIIGNNTALARTWDGDFAEIALYDRELSASEIAFLESYYSIKWGIDTNVFSSDFSVDFG